MPEYQIFWSCKNRRHSQADEEHPRTTTAEDERAAYTNALAETPVECPFCNPHSYFRDIPGSHISVQRIEN